MASVLRTAYVNVLPKTDDFDPELKKRLGRIDASQHGERIGKSFGGAFASTAGKLIGGINLLFAGIQVAGFFKDSIAEAREAIKVGKITEEGIRSTGGAAKISAAQIGDLAMALSNKSAVDDELIQSGENMLLTFTRVRNEVGKGNDIFNQASSAILDMSARMGNGVVTAEGLKTSTIQVGKALNDPIQGMTALHRVGVDFTDQQKEQIKNFVASGNIMGAQKIILRELATEFGGTAAAAADPAQKAQVAWGNLKEQIGGIILPLFNRFSGFLISNVIPAVQSFIGGLQGKGPIEGFAGALNTLGLGLRALVAAFKEGGVTSTGFVGAMERIGVVARDAFDGFKQAWVDLSKTFNAGQIKVLAVALGALAVSIWAVTAPVSLVAVGIGALVVGFGLAYKHSELFRKIVDVVVAGLRIWADYMLWTWHHVWEPAFVALGAAAVTTWGVLKPIFQAIGAAATWLWLNILQPYFTAVAVLWRNVIGPTAIWLWQNAIQPAMAGIGFAVKVAVSIITTLFGVWMAYINNVTIPTIRFFWDVISNVFSNVSAKIQTVWFFVRPIFEALGNAVRNDLVGRIQTGVAIIGALWDSLKAKAETPVRFVVDVVLNNLINAWNTIAKAFGGTRIPPISFGGGGGGGGGGRVMALASGGVYPGYTPGRDVGLAAVSGGEAIMRPEWTRVVGKDYVEAVNAAARSGGTGGVARFLGGYADGGIIGFLTDPAGWFKDRVGAVGDIARRFGSNPFVEMLAGGSRKLVDAAIEKAKGLLSLGGGPLGGAGGNIGWQAMWKIIHGAFPAAQLFSGYRPGDRAESGSLSYHALGRAIDITPSVVIGRWIAAHYGAMTKELIHTPMGGEQIWNGRPYTFTGAALQAAHYNHVHWAMNRGGVVDNSRPQRLDDYTIQRLAQALTGRPVNVAINGPDWGLSVAGWST